MGDLNLRNQTYLIPQGSFDKTGMFPMAVKNDLLLSHNNQTQHQNLLENPEDTQNCAVFLCHLFLTREEFVHCHQGYSLPPSKVSSSCPSPSNSLNIGGKYLQALFFSDPVTGDTHVLRHSGYPSLPSFSTKSVLLSICFILPLHIARLAEG